ncbi:MAG: type II secretion system F family protein [Rhodobacteraceae bacterium]|nr:type II secretion system F family protein [Alphaproteobacteria bacterium]NNK65402.1 type II secretion system F family protein [Paracoccaceae bacterium]
MTNQDLILAAVFMAVLLLVYTILNVVFRGRDVSRNIARVQTDRRALKDAEIDEYLGSETDNIQYYFEVMNNEGKDSLRMRLIRAGYFNRSALTYFNLIRIGVAIVFFVAAVLATTVFVPGTSTVSAMVLGMIVSGVVFIFASFMLDNRGKKKEIEYRKMFPDFMDLLIVCVDAGLSFEAAIDRTAREFLATNPDFGTHLGIISLEIRAGRPSYEALTNFGNRTNIEEAKSLATLFRQSEELGSSVSKTLRTFSTEMRQMRIIRAEEKANSLPVRMIFPIGLFMFPVNLIIVLVPVLVTIIKIFTDLQPAGSI